MRALAEEAEKEKRWMHAAFYYRAAEFYFLKESAEKMAMYTKFIEHFDRAFKADGFIRDRVKYEKGYLPVMIVKAEGKKKGTLVMHGGFDSFIEEFYSWMRTFAEAGYEVIAFEGPGQGGARRKYNLPLDYRWEKPVKAVLDHFKLKDVTLLGISMGGWFCFRAAAHEPRIKRVIASSIAYDYMKTMPGWIRVMHEFFIKHFRKMSNRISLNGIEKEKGLDAWMGAQLLYITMKPTPMEAFEVWLALNEDNLHSDKVKQDVLILTGAKDHFIPLKAHHMQVAALTNARSIDAKIFTEETQAHNHCQVGNTGLALKVMIDWMDSLK
jgi:pimeloyl-ACP methyl ester carboxylesterase